MKQRITRLGAAVLLAAGVAVALAAPSQAGDQATTNIAKVVIGTPNPAATFTVNFACTGNLAPINQNYNFNAAGAPSPQQDTHVTFGFIGTCTITETNTGGAVHVTYACATVQPNATCSGGGTAPAVITFTTPGAIGTTVGTVTVTNDFTPDPAVAVVAPANFTG